MRSTHLFQTWVKNVYSMCAEGVVNGVNLSPLTNMHLPATSNLGVQPTVFTHTFNSFAPSMYTANFSHFNPLSIHLYTLSTPPTIKKNKKK